MLSFNPDKTAKLIKEKLEAAGIRDVSIEKKPSVSEYLSTHYEIKIGSQPVVYLFRPLACHSYNTIKVEDKIYRIATIDTMLSFYLLFLYIDRPYFNPKRILCMCEYLFKIQQKNRVKLRGILRRFSVTCYGKQKTIEDIRNDKAEQFRRLKNKRKTREYDKWFLRYNPENNPSNKPFIEKNKPKKTNEDIINEAKLAFEAKAIASNAIINQIEKIQKETSVSKRKNVRKTKKNANKRAKSYMQTIPVMIEPESSTKSRSRNKTLRHKAGIEAGTSIIQEKIDKNISDKEVENILYVKDIITPSSLSTSSSRTPDSENIIFVE
jgi:23S rRNA maturation mini-RNase III